MKVRRLFGWAAIIIFAAAGAIVILVHNSSIQQWTLHRLEIYCKKPAESNSPHNISISIHNKLQATLDGVAYVENGTSVRASRVAIDLPWKDFTSVVKEITSLEVDNLEIKLNSAEALVPSPSGEPTPFPKIRFDRLVVRNGSLDYRNQSLQFQIPAILD
jgi:hypothetical protein